jgi:hypothetical protein
MNSQSPQKLPASDREASARDPESPEDIVHDNILLPIAVALVVLLGAFGLAIALGG